MLVKEEEILRTEKKVINKLAPTLNAEAEPQSKEKTSAIPRLNLIRQLPTPEALQLIPEALARQYKVIPLMVSGDRLEVAMADPGNILTIEALSARSKKRIEAVPASETDILEAIDFNYKAFGQIKEQLNTVAVEPEVSEQKIIADIADDAPLARALSSIIEEAVKSRSSDIHIEPDENKLRIRYRIDGTLHDVLSLPMSVHPSLMSRIKILGGMNIADYRRPQDGQISLNVANREIDIRVGTAYTVDGEMAVLRLLDKSLAVFSLPQLGFLPESQERYERMLLAPYGMILASGPTGAGKTTTLYASVNSLDRVGRHIITIEDPVEYRFEGMNQIQVNLRAGLTFATGLRSIVRLDPDVILVGEIRDSDTTQIAIQAALTGHLVLSSVHANDSTGALFRLIDLGAEPFLVCSAVIGIVAQRMVRRVCPHCGRSTPVSLVEQTAYHKIMGEERKEFLVGAGCKNCTYTGYLGRVGIFEILLMTDGIRQLTMSGAAASQVRAQAIEEGMAPLAKDGMLKAKAGITTPSEVVRNAYTMD